MLASLDIIIQGPISRCNTAHNMRPTLPPEARVLPSVASNPQICPPLYPTNSQFSCHGPKACHPGLSLLTPVHLPCPSTSTSRLPRSPHPSSNHHILLTISPKSYSVFHYPAKVSARFSKLCWTTGCPYTTAAKSLYPSFSRGKSSVQASGAAAKHSNSGPPAGAFPSKLRIARSSRPGHIRLRQTTRRRLRMPGP